MLGMLHEREVMKKFPVPPSKHCMYVSTMAAEDYDVRYLRVEMDAHVVFIVP